MKLVRQDELGNMVIENSLKIQRWITRLIEDPLVKLLLKNSLLSKIQLETLLIDILSENIVGIPIKYEDKAKLRQRNKDLSRGAFNRTLKQANNNIKKSINTIILLGYLGIFDSPQLQPLIEISTKLNVYVKNYINLWNKQKKDKIENKNIDDVYFFKNDLIESINRYLST